MIVFFRVVLMAVLFLLSTQTPVHAHHGQGCKFTQRDNNKIIVACRDPEPKARILFTTFRLIGDNKIFPTPYGGTGIFLNKEIKGKGTYVVFVKITHGNVTHLMAQLYVKNDHWMAHRNLTKDEAGLILKLSLETNKPVA